MDLECSGKNKRPFHNEAGFTLIEVMIAMAIFAIGILAVGSMQLRSVKSDSSSRWYTEAGTIASNQVETLLLRNYTDVSLAAGNYGPFTGLGPGGKYSLSYQVVQNTSNTKTVTISVTWAHGAKSVGLSFMKAPVQNVS